MTKTLLNRRTAAAVGVVFLGQIVMAIGGMLLSTPLEHTFVFFIFLWWVVGTMAAIAIEPRMWPTAIGLGIGFLVAAALPAHSNYVASCTTLLLTINLVIVWRPKEVFPKDNRLARALRGKSDSSTPEPSTGESAPVLAAEPTDDETP